MLLRNILHFIRNILHNIRKYLRVAPRIDSLWSIPIFSEFRILSPEGTLCVLIVIIVKLTATIASSCAATSIILAN
jgi:hypothetical protein